MADVLTAEAVRDELGGLAGWSKDPVTGRDLELARRIDEIVGSVR
ncbi:hypothetical protein AB0D32_24835 [Micromonospora sp. NPDC048170]